MAESASTSQCIPVRALVAQSGHWIDSPQTAGWSAFADMTVESVDHPTAA